MNNTVQVTTLLTCSAVDVPPIGTQNTLQAAFIPGDTALDSYINVGVSPTALNPNIGGGGLLQVINPARIGDTANTKALTILCAAQAMGPVMPGGSVLLPLADGTIYNATVTSGTLPVGVTVLKCSPNT